jgi:DNA-directed RNA polymerase subunit M/transcription elongation factor TFIIS
MDIDDETPVEESVPEITNVKYENFNLTYQQISTDHELKEKCVKIINKTCSESGWNVVNELYSLAQTESDCKEIFLQHVKDYCFYIQDKSHNEAISMIKSKFNCFETYEDQYEKEIRNLEKPVKIHEIDGIYECKKCGSTKTYYWSAQLRRSDEPPTTFVNCIKCKNKWVDNG